VRVRTRPSDDALHTRLPIASEGITGTVEDQPQLPELKEVDQMAASLIIEEESGTCAGKHHQHNGYYAGDFSEVPMPTRSMSDGPKVVIRIARQQIEARVRDAEARHTAHQLSPFLRSFA
jgi:hypothetical protein